MMIVRDLIINDKSSLKIFDKRHPFLYDYQHIFDALHMFNDFHLTLLPVLDKNKKFLGVVTVSSLIEYLAKALSVSDPGALIILEMGVNDFVFSEMARIMEENDAKILNLIVFTEEDSSNIIISVKINLIDAEPVIQTLERLGYNIISSFNNKNDDYIRDRFESFMKYLDI